MEVECIHIGEHTTVADTLTPIQVFQLGRLCKLSRLSYTELDSHGPETDYKFYWLATSESFLLSNFG